MDVQTAVGGGFENAGWDEEAERDCYDQVWCVGRRRRPGSEGVDLVDGYRESGGDWFDGDLGGGSAVGRRVIREIYVLKKTHLPGSSSNHGRRVCLAGRLHLCFRFFLGSLVGICVMRVVNIC